MSADDDERSDEGVARVAEGLLGRAVTLTRAPVASNARVFHVEAGDRRYFAKVFPAQRHDGTRDRALAEHRFLSELWAHGVRCIPEPIAYAPQPRVLVTSFIEGVPFEAADEAAIEAAVRFVAQLTDLGAAALSLPPAADAATTLADHLAIVGERVSKTLEALDGSASAELARLLDIAHRAAVERAKGAWPGGSAVRRLPSPSDFGFHNALRTPDGVIFVDFEHAGWDGPAKLASDFLLSPRVPVPPEARKALVGALDPDGAGLLDEQLTAVLPLHRVKWASLVLGVHDPATRARRRFAGQEVTAETVARAEALARAMLGSELTTDA